MRVRLELSLEQFRRTTEALEFAADVLEESAAARRGSFRFRHEADRQRERDQAQVYRHTAEELRLQKEDQEQDA